MMAVWLAGAAVSFGFHGWRYALFLRGIRRWKYTVANQVTQRIFTAEKLQLGIRRTVKLYHCPSIGSPMMVGLVRPMLLLPDEAYSEEELALVFRHELIHLKRGDLLVKVGLTFACALHWYNPAVYVLCKQIGFWQESACDEAVISNTSMADKQFYSETIIRAIRRQVRIGSALTTTFYGGKNGMKRRIMAIMENKKKRTGIVLWAAVVVLVSCFGMAFAVDTETAEPPGLSTMAFVTPVDADGARMLTVPSVNDLELPLAAYFAGTPVTIVETRESSALEEWNSVEGEDNWAYVLVGGDGIATGLRGWIPLINLSDTQTVDLPTAKLTTDSPTDFVNVYARNELESNLVNTYQEGTEVTLLGRVQQWYQIEVEGLFGFVPRENLAIDDVLQARLDTFLPYRFDTISRKEYDGQIIFSRLYEEKSKKYEGKSLEYWSLEDKAWYGQMEETYLGGHDHYYQLPQEGDLPQNEAIDIAWKLFMEKAELPVTASQDDYDIYLGFFAIPTMDGYNKRWDVRFCDKGGINAAFLITIDAASGEVLSFYPSFEPVG